MKVWLQNIVACPICKNHPLDLKILEWDPDSDKDEKKLKDYFSKDFEKNIISPKSLTSIQDLTDNFENKKKIEDLKEIFSKIKNDMALKEVIKLLGKNLNNILEIIYFMSIKTGVFHCKKCKRWYPIGNSIQGVPEMLPDDLRDKVKDMKFVTKWKKKLPKNILD